MKKMLLVGMIVWTSLLAQAKNEKAQEATLTDLLNRIPWEQVELLQRFYENSVESENGRTLWHGKKISSVLDVSNEVTIVTYADGKVFKDKAKQKTPKESVDEANKKLKKTVNKNGIPTKLAELREKRAKEKETELEVSVELTAGGKSGKKDKPEEDPKNAAKDES